MNHEYMILKYNLDKMIRYKKINNSIIQWYILNNKLRYQMKAFKEEWVNSDSHWGDWMII